MVTSARLPIVDPLNSVFEKENHILRWLEILVFYLSIFYANEFIQTGLPGGDPLNSHLKIERPPLSLWVFVQF